MGRRRNCPRYEKVACPPVLGVSGDEGTDADELLLGKVWEGDHGQDGDIFRFKFEEVVLEIVCIGLISSVDLIRYGYNRVVPELGVSLEHKLDRLLLESILGGVLLGELEESGRTGYVALSVAEPEEGEDEKQGQHR